MCEKKGQILQRVSSYPTNDKENRKKIPGKRSVCVPMQVEDAQ